MWDYEAIEAFLKSRITFLGLPDSIGSRIDFLEMLAATLRYRHRHFEHQVEFETFIQCDVTADDRIVCSAPEYYCDISTGTPPVLLQPDLLIFLMLFDKEEYRVIDIIERFIRHPHVYSKLSVEDFKKTETGVTRCFTNTRFAAKNLREYGFLKFTKVEAYKTWRLTIAGFVAAAVLLKRQRQPNRRAPRESLGRPLHLEIWDVWAQIQDYRAFVSVLASICKPNIDLFEKGKPLLHYAHRLLSDYWTALTDIHTTAEERRRLCMRCIDQLENQPAIEAFKKEFSGCVAVDNLLASLEEDI